MWFHWLGTSSHSQPFHPYTRSICKFQVISVSLSVNVRKPNRLTLSDCVISCICCGMPHRASVPFFTLNWLALNDRIRRHGRGTSPLYFDLQNINSNFELGSKIVIIIIKTKQTIVFVLYWNCLVKTLHQSDLILRQWFGNNWQLWIMSSCKKYNCLWFGFFNRIYSNLLDHPVYNLLILIDKEREINEEKQWVSLQLNTTWSYYTFYKLQPRRLYTWKSPRDNEEDIIIRNQIYYIFVNKRYRNRFNNVKTCPDADIQSNHNPLVDESRSKLKKIRGTTVKRPNIGKMKCSEVKESKKVTGRCKRDKYVTLLLSMERFSGP